MNQERFRFFPVKLKESDLLIGVPHAQFREEMFNISFNELLRLRKVLDNYTNKQPSFGTSMMPISIPKKASKIPHEILTMMECGQKTGTGPMSAVAGLFAEYVGRRLVNCFELDELVVENGGDLYLKNDVELISVIHAGKSLISDKMAFALPAGSWGICTSSGTMGHSFSYGKADAVTIIAQNAPLADAWATSLANRVKTAKDIEPVLDQVSEIEEILGCAIIVGDKIGIRGTFELKLLS